MATTARHQAAVITELQQQPAAYQFTQAVRLLSRWLADDAEIQFRTAVNFSFSYSEIMQLQIPAATAPEQQYVLMVNFMGLLGQEGALPTHITETVLERLYLKDSTLLDFLAVFQHQLLALYYAVLSQPQFYVHYEADQPDCTIQALQHFSNQTLDDPDIGLYYAGLFAQQARSAAGLQQLLSSYFNTTITVSQYTPRWFALSSNEKTLIGRNGQQQHLGHNAIAGNRVWQVQNQFTVWVGPLDYGTFQQFLPEQTQLEALATLVRAYIGLEHDFEVRLLLRSVEIPTCTIGTKLNTKLGWTTWLNGALSSHSTVVVSLTHALIAQ